MSIDHFYKHRKEYCYMVNHQQEPSVVNKFRSLGRIPQDDSHWLRADRQLDCTDRSSYSSIRSSPPHCQVEDSCTHPLQRHPEHKWYFMIHNFPTFNANPHNWRIRLPPSTRIRINIRATTKIVTRMIASSSIVPVIAAAPPICISNRIAHSVT